MTRLAAIAHTALPRILVIAPVMHHIGQIARMKRDARRLDAMSSDRLKDMGIAPRTEANFRTSGEQGQVPRTSLW